MSPEMTPDEARVVLLMFAGVGLVVFAALCWGIERLQNWWSDRGARKW